MEDANDAAGTGSVIQMLKAAIWRLAFGEPKKMQGKEAAGLLTEKRLDLLDRSIQAGKSTDTGSSSEMESAAGILSIGK